MRILIVSPGSLEIPGGNSSAILRLQEGLRTLGHTVETRVAGPFEAGSLAPGSFDVVHGFHVYRGGWAAMEAARAARARGVVTLTGTETSVDWKVEKRRAGMRNVLESGAGVIALRRSHLEELRGLSGLALEDAVVIPQTIRVGHEPFDVRAKLGLQADARLVLLPGGLRLVKGQDWALDVLERGAGGHVPWHLVLAGPVLDEDFARALLKRVDACERAHYLGVVEPSRMGACYAACELVLNTSEAEGESNAILEAMHVGRAVLARGNPGNGALIDGGRNGVLFASREEMEAGVQRLLGDAGWRGGLISAARESVRDRADWRREVQAHLDFYAGPAPRSQSPGPV